MSSGVRIAIIVLALQGSITAATAADPACLGEAKGYVTAASDDNFSSLAHCIADTMLERSAGGAPAPATSTAAAPHLPPPSSPPGQGPDWLPVPPDLFLQLTQSDVLSYSSTGTLQVDTSALTDLVTHLQQQPIVTPVDPQAPPDFGPPDIPDFSGGGDFGGGGPGQ